MRRVFLSPDAEADLAEIRAWYSQLGSGASAKRKVQSILNALEHRLAASPLEGRLGANMCTRELVVARHRLVYMALPQSEAAVDDCDILVIAIFGPGQNR